MENAIIQPLLLLIVFTADAFLAGRAMFRSLVVSARDWPVAGCSGHPRPGAGIGPPCDRIGFSPYFVDTANIVGQAGGALAQIRSTISAKGGLDAGT